MSATFSRLLALLTLTLVLAACTQSKPSRYYVLTPEPGTATAGETSDAKRDGLTIGFSTVHIPRYLDRLDIVTTTMTSQLSLAEFDKWGEPLDENIVRVVALNLARKLQTDRVFLVSERNPVKLDYLVELSIVEFDLNLNGNAALLARWTIVDGPEDRELLVSNSRLSSPVNGDGYGDMIDAMSRNLGSLSTEISKAIRSLDSAR